MSGNSALFPLEVLFRTHKTHGITKNNSSGLKIGRKKLGPQENLVGAESAPTAVSRTFTPLVRRIWCP